MKPVRQKLCGVLFDVRLVKGNAAGSVCISWNDNGKPAYITVGADAGWRQVYATLLHEAIEAASMILQLRFEKTDIRESDSGGMYFFWSHENFTNIINEVGYFMADVVPDLATVYNAWHKKKKKK